MASFMDKQEDDPLSGAIFSEAPKPQDTPDMPVDTEVLDDPLSGAVIRGGPTSTDTPEEGAEPVPSKQNPSDDWSQFDTFEEANAAWFQILDNPNVRKVNPIVGSVIPYAIFTDPDTQEQTYIRRPEPASIRAGIKAAGKAVKGDWEGAKEAFNNPAAKTGVATDIVTGGMEFLGQAAETVAAAGDKVMGTNMAPTVDQMTPDVELRGIAENLLGEGVPMVVAGLAGGAYISGVTKGLKTIQGGTKFIQGLAKVARGTAITLAAESSAVVGASDDAGGLLIGKDALFSLTGDLDLGDTKADDIIEKRLTLLADAVLGGSILAAAGQLTVGVSKFSNKQVLSPLLTLLRGDAGLEKAVYRNLINTLQEVDLDTSPEEMAAIAERLAAAVEENKDVLVKNIYDQGETTVQRDTLSAMAEGATTPEDKVRVLGVQRGVLTNAPQNPNTAAKTNGLNVELQRQIDTQADTLSGPLPSDQEAAINSASQGLVDDARRRVDEIQQPVADLEVKLKDAEDRILNAWEGDVEFTARLDKLKDITGTEVVMDRTGLKDNMTTALRNGYEIMRATKNEKYGMISGGSVDPQMVIDMFADLPPETISAGMSQLGNSNPLRKLIAITREGEDELEILENVTDFLAQNGADFGFFNNTLRPELSRLASNLYKTSPGAGSLVRDIVNRIDTDMVDHVRLSDPDLAEAAVEAKRYFAEEFSPVWGGTNRMSEYANIWEDTVGRTSNRDLTRTVTGDEFDASGYAQRSDAFVEEALGDKRFVITSFKTALETAGRPDDIADYMVMDIMDSFSTQLRSAGDIADIDLGAFTAKLDMYAEQLNTAFPDKAAQINAFKRSVEDAKGSKTQLLKIFDTVTEKAKAAQDEILKGELKTFFSAGDMPSINATSNPREAFNQIFMSKESVGSVTKILDRLDTMPEGDALIIRRGMQTAYNRYLDSTIFGSRQELAGGMAMNSGKVAKTLEENNQVFAIGDQIFRDAPEIMDSLRTLTDAASKVANNKSAVPIATNSSTAYNQAAQTATNRMLYLVLGPLNRLATQIRSVASTKFQSADAIEKAARIKDNILANPDEYLRLSRKYDKTPGDPELQDRMLRLITGSAVRSLNDESTEETEYPDWVTENSAANRSRNIADQMTDAFRFLTGR